MISGYACKDDPMLSRLLCIMLSLTSFKVNKTDFYRKQKQNAGVKTNWKIIRHWN